jgi:hypothetical protein
VERQKFHTRQRERGRKTKQRINTVNKKRVGKNDRQSTQTTRGSGKNQGEREMEREESTIMIRHSEREKTDKERMKDTMQHKI